VVKGTGRRRSVAEDAVRWAGRVAFIVASAVALGWAVSLVVYMVARLSGDPVGSDAATLLSTVGGVLAGAVATYLGNSSEPRPPSTRERVTDTPPADVPPLTPGDPPGVVSAPDRH